MAAISGAGDSLTRFRPDTADMPHPAQPGGSPTLQDGGSPIIQDGGSPLAAMVGALDGIGQGVLVMNARQQIVLINQPARAMLQLMSVEVEGLALRDVLARSPVLNGHLAETLHARCIDAEVADDDIPLSLAPLVPGPAAGRRRPAKPPMASPPLPVTARIRNLAGQHRAIFLDPAATGAAPGDPLTGLADRRGFIAGLRAAVEAPARGRTGTVVLAVDLGRLKQVNDSLGHPAGDELLRGAAGRLRNVLRRHDLAARLGNDEFAVLAAVGPGSSGRPGSPASEDAASVTRRILDVMGQPFLLHGHVVNVEARAGVALAPEHGREPEVLLRRAGLALRQARLDGCESRLFEPGMQSRAETRHALEQDLRRALGLRQFELHYQPLVNLAGGGLTGFEALIRWRHPERGLVPPNDFIPLAEEIGLISELGAWVVHEACREAVRWPSPLRVAVNASSVQFESGTLVAEVGAALASTGLPGHRLEVEVTETTLLRRADTTLGALRELRAMGVRIAMDDFGTGYSSLTQLQSFPFDKLKIDRSFVARMGGDADGTAIVRAIARMGASLGLCTVAEGVETREQLDALRVEGCDEVQGFLLGRPVPQAEVGHTLSRFGA